MGQSEGSQGCEHVTIKFHIQRKKEVHNNNRLARSIFEEKALKKHIISIAVKECVREQSIKDTKEDFRLCYKNADGHDLKVPKVTFHFTSADVDLPREVTLLEVQKGLVCLMIVLSDNFAIFENLS
ncbi:hypothetical protein LguiB_026480 [Lonicera macranthoides]